MHVKTSDQNQCDSVLLAHKTTFFVVCWNITEHMSRVTG